jgi:hypothetical protein
MKDVDIRSRGKLSIVSNRSASFDGYGNQVRSGLSVSSGVLSRSGWNLIG